MTDEQIDKITKKYWDHKLKDTTIKNEKTEYDWYGLFDSSGELLVGCVIGDDDDTWFYNEQSFVHGSKIFGITNTEFKEAFKRYLKKTYGFNIHILF